MTQYVERETYLDTYQLAHLHSILPSHSRSNITRFDSIVLQNDGHPDPLSYFPEEEKSDERQYAQLYVPSTFL